MAIVPTISDEDAATKFSAGFETQELPSGQGYLRMTTDPSLKVDVQEKEEEATSALNEVMDSKDDPVMVPEPTEVTTTEP